MNFLLILHITLLMSCMCGLLIALTAIEPSKGIVMKFINIRLNDFYNKYIFVSGQLYYKHNDSIESICEAIDTINNNRDNFMNINGGELLFVTMLKNLLINYDNYTKKLFKLMFFLAFVSAAIRRGLNL